LNTTSAVPTIVESNDVNPSNCIISRFNQSAAWIVKRAGFVGDIGAGFICHPVIKSDSGAMLARSFFTAFNPASDLKLILAEQIISPMHE
jgi:hypothetical protein